MFIRRTTIKSRNNAEPYYTHRLVESERVNGRVKQRIVLNLGRHFDVPPPIQSRKSPSSAGRRGRGETSAVIGTIPRD